MNPIAQRLSEASVLLEGTPHPELVEALRIGADEIQRLQALVDTGIKAVRSARRFYFRHNPPNTGLACGFNAMLEALGVDINSKEAWDDWRAHSAGGNTNG